jgi:hypothetical protein
MDGSIACDGSPLQGMISASRTEIMAKIYLSSTYSDLKDYREHVSLVLRRMGHEDVAMEYYVAEDQRSVGRCLADVAACDVYLGIFAWCFFYRFSWKNRLPPPAP